MTDTTLGQRIAEGRKKLGLSQEAFGDRLGVSRQAASKWESDAAVPEIDKLITMSKIFGVSIGWLLGVEDPESPTEGTLSEEQLAAVTELLCRYPTPCPERKNRKWLVAACAAGLVVSLTVGILGLFLPKSKTLIQTEDPDPALQSQIDSLIEQNVGLQSQIVELTTQRSETEKIQDKILSEQAKEIDALRQQLDELNTKPEEDDTTVVPDQIHPANDLLDSWALSPKIDIVNNTIALRFSGFTELEAAEARLIAILGGHEMASKVCERTTTGYTAEMSLPAVDGYTYYFVLLHQDGTRQQTELAGHGLSFLSSGMQPGFTFTTGAPVGNGSRSFWICSPSVILEAPELIPESVQCQWSGLRIVYYHNGEAVEQKDLTEALSDISMYDRQLAFDLYTVTFDFADTAEGSSHSLRLEGSVAANGLEHTFSLPLGDWVLCSGKLADAPIQE